MSLPLFLRPSAATALATLLGALLLGGCATFSRDGGFDAVESIAKERLNKEVTWIRSAADAGRVQERVKELLAGPLSVDDAMQVALPPTPTRCCRWPWA